MRKIITTLAVVSLAVPAVAFAAKEPKVFVCKYVGTPGVDERLQTGQNPIDVSENAIKNFQGVGSYFNDAQGRSYVIAEDTGQDEPNVSECPQPTNPTPPSTPPTTPPSTNSNSNNNSSVLGTSTNNDMNINTFQGK